MANKCARLDVDWDSDDTEYRRKPVLEAISNTCYSIKRLLYLERETFSNSRLFVSFPLNLES